MKFIYILVVVFFFMSTDSFSQSKTDSKLRFQSISTGIGICAGEINAGGISAYIDASMLVDKNLFSFAISSGAELNLFDESRDYTEIAFLYGRELTLSRVIKLEPQVGLAYFKVRYKNGETDYRLQSESAVGLPLRLKLLFYVSSHIALGLNPNVTFNSVENTYSVNIILQYKL